MVLYGWYCLMLRKTETWKTTSFLNRSVFPSQLLGCSFAFTILVVTKMLCQDTVFCLLLEAGILKSSSLQVFVCCPVLGCFHYCS